MHFFAYEDRSLLYRRKIEKLFRVINLAIWALQMLLVVIGIVLIVISAEDMFTSSPIAAGGSISLNSYYTSIFNNCSSTTTVDTFLLKKVPYTVDDGNVKFLLGLYTEKVIQAIVIGCVSVIITFINKLFYDFNFFFYKIKFIIIRKDLASTLDIIFLCGSIAANAIAHDFAAPLRNHVIYCSEVVNADSIAATASTSSRNYLAPSNFVPIYIAQSLTLLTYVICFGLLMKHTLIDEEVPEPPEEDDDEDMNDDEDPQPDAKAQRPPQDDLDIEREARILDIQKNRARNNNNNNQHHDAFSGREGGLYLTNGPGGVVDSPGAMTGRTASPGGRNQQQPQPVSKAKVRGGFAAMRAAAAFKGAGSSNKNNNTSTVSP